jgi:hypothetical protein
MNEKDGRNMFCTRNLTGPCSQKSQDSQRTGKKINDPHSDVKLTFDIIDIQVTFDIIDIQVSNNA